MPQYTNWEMLVPQPTGVVHNLIRNPSFEYSDDFFAGRHQYWWYYSPAGTKNTGTAATDRPQISTNWSAFGANSLACTLDGTTNKHVEYGPRLSTFEAMNITLGVSLAFTTPAAYSSNVYPSGTHYVCAFLLSPYGSALASTSDVEPVTVNNQLIQPEGYNVVDLMRGKGIPYFSAGVTVPAATNGLLTATITPSAGMTSNDFSNAGIAVFWSRPNDVYPGTTNRAWRCVYVRPAYINNTTTALTFTLPSIDSTSYAPLNWQRGSTTFYTNASPTFNTFTIMDETGAAISASYIGLDSSQPSFAITPSGTPWNLGTTYSHHVYLDWYIDTNYVSGTIGCACDYTVTFIDTGTGTTYTPVNPDTGNNALAAVPSNRALDKRTGRTKLLLTPPNNSVNTNAGLDLRMRITMNLASTTAVLYIDAVQFVDIRYKGQDELDWDDVEFTYLDGDVAGAEWSDFAPSYTSISGTAVNGLYPSSVWMGTTNAGWTSSFSMPNRDLLLNANTVDINTYGGTSYKGYAQSAMRAFSSESGTYYPIDADHLGASVNVTTTGVGMPEIVTVTQPYGVIDGGLVQRQVANMRTVQLTIDFVGSSQADLHNRRRKFINALKFDQLVQQGDRVIRYSGSGTPVLYRVTYTGGLEFTGNVGVSFSEAASIQFVCADPYVYAERSVGTTLTLASDTQDTRTWLAYRQGDNQPWVYTGMKDYSDLFTIPGYLTQPIATALSQGSNGTLSMTVTAATTLTIGADTVTVTAGAAFFYGDTRDVGRTVYARVGAGNIFVVGVVAYNSSTTVVTLSTNAVGGAATYTSGNWWVSNKYASNSSTTLSSAWVGSYLTSNWNGSATVFGKIVATTAGQIELSAYYFGLTNSVAIPSGTWGTYGFTGNGTIGGITAVSGGPFSGAYVPQLEGMLLYGYRSINPIVGGWANPIVRIASVTSSTTMNVDFEIAATGTISVAASNAGTTTVTGVGTKFTTEDVTKVIVTKDGRVIGRIASVSSSTSVTLNVAYPLAVGATAFRLMYTGGVSTQAPGTLAESAPLNWSGGFHKYHMGFIQSPVSNSVAIVVGGFDNGRPSLGFGVSRYLAIVDMDARQNTDAGNYSNLAPTSDRGLTQNATNGLITYTLGSSTITTSASYTFWPQDVGVELYRTNSIASTEWIGTIRSWDSPTQVTIWGTAPFSGTGVLAYKRSTANVPNMDYASVRPLLNNVMTRSAAEGATNYWTVVPTEAISAIYQETPTTVLIAGRFRGYSQSGAISVTDIRIIRIRGWVKRSPSTDAAGAPTSASGNTLDIDIVARDSTAGWGTPSIFCITSDPLGNLYVGGVSFTTSNIWYIGRATDGTSSIVYSPLGAYTSAAVTALITDTKFPIANVYAAVDASPFLLVYAYWNARSSAGSWSNPSLITLGSTVYTQGPNDTITSFLRTQAGDILIAGYFRLWGPTFVNGMVRFVPKIGTSATDNPAVVTAAVPCAGTFSQPGISDMSTGAYIATMADASYGVTNSAYAGTGERLAFGGFFRSFRDGRTSLAMGYLEGSGSASSVRRMTTSDLGLEPPMASTNYPVVQKIATTSRSRLYYANNQVTRTDNLVGPTIAALITQSDGVDFQSGSPYFRTGASQYASTNNVGIPQIVNCTVNVRGNANVYPVITFTMSANTAIFEIIQTETGARIRFDDLYGLRGIVPSFANTAEVITLDTRPGYRSVTSSIRGSMMQFVTPESNFGDFYLLAPFTSQANTDTTRPNTIVIRYTITNVVVSGTAATQFKPTVSILYTPRFWSFDVSKLFNDAPDTAL
jgi:hypothetical protein